MIESNLYGAFDPLNPPQLPGPFARIVQADPAVISAPREEVWKTLSDFPRYQEWCRFTRLIETSGQIGDPVYLHLRWDDSLRKPTQTQKEIISIWKEGEAMGWSLSWPGLLRAERFQHLEAISKDQTIYRTADRFSGLLTPLVFSLYGQRMMDGFNNVARSLRDYLER